MTPTGSLSSLLRNYRNDVGLTAMGQQKIGTHGEAKGANKFANNGHQPRRKDRSPQT